MTQMYMQMYILDSFPVFNIRDDINLKSKFE